MVSTGGIFYEKVLIYFCLWHNRVYDIPKKNNDYEQSGNAKYPCRRSKRTADFQNGTKSIIR